MEQCPTCRSTYSDDTLRYCLADGAALSDLDSDAETLLRRDGPATLPASKSSSSSFVKIAIAVMVLGIVGLIGAGLATVLYFASSGSDGPVISPSPSATPDAEKARLEKELEELQKKLNEVNTTYPQETPPGFESDELPTATVNSPNDGFLALRSEPDSERGDRLAQIPHGTVITLENCENERVKIGSRTGRWCMVTYRGQTGWVFDAWLVY